MLDVYGIDCTKANKKISKERGMLQTLIKVFKKDSKTIFSFDTTQEARNYSY